MKAVVKTTMHEIMNAGDIKRVESDVCQVRFQSANSESEYDILSVESRLRLDYSHN